MGGGKGVDEGERGRDGRDGRDGEGMGRDGACICTCTKFYAVEEVGKQING